MKKTLLDNSQVRDLLSEEAYVKYSRSMRFVYLVCKSTGMYFQVEDINDNTLLITTSAAGLEKYFKEVYR
ncbi:MAG: hypothetical protein J6Q89_07835 [Clostridia bacterium]|nr:hypothetical protein [Clostridia bacterium]